MVSEKRTSNVNLTIQVQNERDPEKQPNKGGNQVVFLWKAINTAPPFPKASGGREKYIPNTKQLSHSRSCLRISQTL